MRAYKCDRCNAFFEEDGAIHIDKLNYKIDCYSIVAACRSLNLCERCKQSFIDWFIEYKEKAQCDV